MDMFQSNIRKLTEGLEYYTGKVPRGGWRDRGGIWESREGTGVIRGLAESSTICECWEEPEKIIWEK